MPMRPSLILLKTGTGKGTDLDTYKAGTDILPISLFSILLFLCWKTHCTQCLRYCTFSSLLSRRRAGVLCCLTLRVRIFRAHLAFARKLFFIARRETHRDAFFERRYSDSSLCCFLRSWRWRPQERISLPRIKCRNDSRTYTRAFIHAVSLRTPPAHVPSRDILTPSSAAYAAYTHLHSFSIHLPLASLKMLCNAHAHTHMGWLSIACIFVRSLHNCMISNILYW